MVKIRYSELQSGLHVSTSGQGWRTVIYLKPGLTTAERRAALIRVRSSSRMGHGPDLPPLGLAIALGTDALRTIAGNGLAAMRRHPVLLLPPLILLVSTGIVFVLMSFVTLTVPQHLQQAAGPPTGHRSRPAPTQVVGTDPGSHTDQEVSAPGTHGQGHGSHGGHGGSSPRPTLTPSTSPSSISSPPPGSSSSSPSPSPSTISQSPTPDPTPTPSPSPTPSSSSTCLQLGPLGLCVSL
jgi:hypothetical protein